MAKTDFTAQLVELKNQFDAGEKKALAMALLLVVANGLDPPMWLRLAFIKAYDDVLKARVPSWDDVLGRRYRNKRELRKAFRMWKLRYPVWHRVRILNQGEGPAIGEPLYRAVAEEHGVGWKTVKKLYEDVQRAGGHRANVYRPHRRARSYTR